MFRQILVISVVLLTQLTTPNDNGVSIGHIHLLSADPDAQKKIWIEAFGAQVTKTGTLELLRLPGVYIVINRAQPTAGSAGSTVDHIGLSVKDLNGIKGKLTAMNIDIQGTFAVLPDGVRVEFLEEQRQTLPVVMHHIHLSSQQSEVLRRWYVKAFGTTFNGNEINFQTAGGTTAPAPTRGRAIDHIGFEVRNLEAFVKGLQGSGVTIEAPYRDMPNLGLKVAFIVDPVGTRIELTEGLAGK